MFDLAGVTYFGSEGIRALVSACTRADALDLRRTVVVSAIVQTRVGGRRPRGARRAVSPAFRRGGEVGADLAAVDWGATSLGVPAEWPGSLTTTVRVMLASRFSMWMAWGDDLTFMCNDAYRRATLGTKYPWALGKPASEVWAEIWDDIGPRIESVLDDGVATWDESLLLYLERNGYREETYHTFSYSPLAHDDGSIVGMLCVVVEETDRVLGERRLATLHDLAGALRGRRGRTVGVRRVRARPRRA